MILRNGFNGPSRSQRQRNAGVEQRLHRLHRRQAIAGQVAARTLSTSMKCVGFCTTTMPIALTRAIRSGRHHVAMFDARTLLSPHFGAAGLAPPPSRRRRSPHRQRHARRVGPPCRTPSRRIRDSLVREIQAAALAGASAYGARKNARRSIGVPSMNPLHAARVDQRCRLRRQAAACCPSFRRRLPASESDRS